VLYRYGLSVWLGQQQPIHVRDDSLKEDEYEIVDRGETVSGETGRRIYG
jgi:hypothetical protein